MKRKICTLLRNVSFAILMIVTGYNSAMAQGCKKSDGFNYININNINARINSGGDIFYDPALKPGFNVPKHPDTSQQKHTIFASSLWVGGYSKGVLKAAAMTYRQSGVDFFPGPLDTMNATTDSAACRNWDKVWKINRSTIDSFRAGLFAAIPAAIRDWPAHGNVNKGFAKNLAPFVDFNKNGIYDPAQGDFPEMKGDQMLWWVFNDKGNIHMETMAYSLGIEVHASAYAFDRPADTALNHTVFVDYKIINRSQERTDSVYFGNYTDFDIGYDYDDYVGSDSVLNAFYAYNGDDFDEGAKGYGQNPPTQSVLLLNRKMNKFVTYNNDFSVIGNPNRPEHYYFFMEGKWKDGQTVKYGGDGRSGSNIPANYMFPGNPLSTDTIEWTPKNAGIPEGGRRGLGSTGPYIMGPGQAEEITYAYVYSRNTEGGGTGALNQMKKDLVHIKSLYNNNLTSKIQTHAGWVVNKVSVYPNPATEQIFINTGNLLAINLRLINVVGQEIMHISNTGSNQTSFSVKDLEAGFYTVLVETKEGTVAKKLLISR